MNDKILFLKKLNKMEGTTPGTHTDYIRKQAQLWSMFAKVSPIIFITLMGFLWHQGIVNHIMIMWIGGIMFGLTAIIWWFWTVHTIGSLATMVKKADNGVQDVLGDLKEIRDILKDIRNDQ